MWSSEWAIEDLQELDRKTQAVMPQNKGKFNSELNLPLCLSPDLGGRGLKEKESIKLRRQRPPTTLRAVKIPI